MKPMLVIATFAALLMAQTSTLAQQPSSAAVLQSVARCHAEFMECVKANRVRANNTVRYGFDRCNYQKSKCNANAPPGVY
jgi:hypothetical protein